MEEKLLFTIQNAISDKLSAPFKINYTQQIFGGDINQTWQISNGKVDYFLKLNTNKPVNFYQKEAEGLQLLRKANHTLKIPTPLLFGQFENKSFLIMEFLPTENPSSNSFFLLGKGLAQLHQNTNTHFGLDTDNYLGSQPQENGWYLDWNTFFTEKRLLPMAKRAFDNHHFNFSDLRHIENLCKALPSIFPNEQPALLHGDLWNGNYGCTKHNVPTIFDPAVYYGNREIDIAMTLLFGGFDESFYLSYNIYFPLAKDWQKRIGICQLYPLLMHLNHFGRSYYPQIADTISKF